MSKSYELIVTHPSWVREQWLSLEVAERTVSAFERRFDKFDKNHLKLACHAALPSILTPELINLIHVNFWDNIHSTNNRKHQSSSRYYSQQWLAESDFLLSHLCHSLDEGVYEVEPCVREVLLLKLENFYQKSQARKIKQELAKFLWIYLQEKSESKQHPEMRQTHEWIVRAYLDPDGLIQEINELLESSFQAADSFEQLSQQIQVVTTLELLADPLKETQRQQEYDDLMRDTRVVAYALYSEEKIVETEPGALLLSSPLGEWLQQTDALETDTLELSSEARLNQLLAQGNWKAADEETANIILKETGREQAGWLRLEDLNQLDCQILAEINDLWRQHSNNCFGFSIQKRIWEQRFGSKKDSQTQRQLGQQLGWCDGKGEWKPYAEMDFSLNAPRGHLPLRCLCGFLEKTQPEGKFVLGLFVFFSRLQQCGL